MLTKISINNFRGIKQGQLDDLQEVNILVGRNNSGKSTVLEALMLARAPIEVKDKLGRHGIQELLRRRVTDRATLDFRELWYRLNTDNEIGLSLKFTNGEILNMKVSYEVPRFIYHVEVEKLGGKSSFGPPPWVRVDSTEFSGAERFKTVLEKENIRALEGLILIDAEYIHKMESVERSLWQSIKVERKDIEIREILNETYGLNIENLSFVPYARDKFKLYAEAPAYSVPIDDLGEGLRYALAILSTMAILEHTMLLIEELEVHQHPEALNYLLTAIFKIAKRNDIQLFISTQSLELINYALQTSEKEKVAIQLYHLILENGILTARGISAPDAKLLADVGPDVRLLHKYVSA